MRVVYGANIRSDLRVTTRTRKRAGILRDALDTVAQKSRGSLVMNYS